MEFCHHSLLILVFSVKEARHASEGTLTMLWTETGFILSNSEIWVWWNRARSGIKFQESTFSFEAKRYQKKFLWLHLFVSVQIRKGFTFRPNWGLFVYNMSNDRWTYVHLHIKSLELIQLLTADFPTWTRTWWATWTLFPCGTKQIWRSLEASGRNSSWDWRRSSSASANQPSCPREPCSSAPASQRWRTNVKRPQTNAQDSSPDRQNHWLWWKNIKIILIEKYEL